MVERICPACQHGNPLDDRFCGSCGAALERQLPMRPAESRLALAGRSLPVTWRQLGKTVALSAAAFAAEAGLLWLRRRMEAGPAVVSPAPSALARVAPPAAPPDPPLARQGSTVTIVSQRIIDIWDSGETRRIVERTFWRKTEG